eukprot:gene19421-19376_t
MLPKCAIGYPMQTSSGWMCTGPEIKCGELCPDTTYWLASPPYAQTICFSSPMELDGITAPKFELDPSTGLNGTRLGPECGCESR